MAEGFLTTSKFQNKHIIQSHPQKLAILLLRRMRGLITSKRIQISLSTYDLSVSYVTVSWPTYAISTLCFLFIHSLYINLFR